MIKAIHDNSIEAFHNLDRTQRRKLVLSIYELDPYECFTDRQVAIRLGFTDMNSVRPSITEILKEEKSPLIECGKIKDFLTRKTVRLVKLYVKE